MLILTHIVAFIVGIGGGWLGHRKFGTKGDAALTSVEKAARDL